MIFVILAIVILGVSFVLALISLTREQKETTGEYLNKPKSVPTIDTTAQQVVHQEPRESPKVSEVDSKKEPFPWESIQSGPSQPQSVRERHLWRNEGKDAGSGEERQALVGEISLKDIEGDGEG